tara:strand:- start:77 stop:271 length:195 start_codon:yes stop_codon:yes gene_type:complete
MVPIFPVSSLVPGAAAAGRYSPAPLDKALAPDITFVAEGKILVSPTDAHAASSTVWNNARTLIP